MGPIWKFCAMMAVVSSIPAPGPFAQAIHNAPVNRNIGACLHLPATEPPFTKPIGLNTNFYLYYNSALANADLSKRGLTWMDAATNGAESQPPSQSPMNSGDWPLQPSTSQIMTGNFQRPNRDGLLPDLVTVDPNDFLILTFDPGTASPLSTQLTDANLTGDVTFDHEDTTNPARTLRYYTCDDAGAIAIFLNTINDWDGDLDLDGDGVGDGDGNNGESFDPDIELWVDGDHMAAYQADNSQIWFDDYLVRLFDLDLGFIRTGPNWSVNNFASGTVFPNTDGQDWDPIWSERTLLDDPLWSVNEGVPWELHTSLANELHVNLWVCIPFVAYDLNDPSDPRYGQAQTYVEGLAALIRDNLDLDLHCYVEFSNETWNPAFTTQRYLMQNYPGLEAEMNALYADNAFHWWLNEWNDCRVEFMAMGDAADSSWVQTLVTELKACNLVDAMGCAGYLKPDKMTANGWGNNSMSNCTETNQPNDSDIEMAVNDSTDANGPGPDDKGLTTLLRQHAVIAVNEGLRYYLYEGGPSLLSANCPFLRSTYATFQNTATEVGNIVDHELNRFVGGVGLDLLSNWPTDPTTGLPFTVEKFGYFAYCQPQDALSGDFLLVTDLYHGLSSAIVNDKVAFKFNAVKTFNEGY